MKLPALLPLLVFLSSALLGQEPNNSISEEVVAQFMGELIKRGARSETIKRNEMVYDKTVVIYDMNKNPPEVKSTEVSRVYGHNGKSIEKVVERDGQAVDEIPKESGLDFNRMIAGKFNFTFQDHTSIGNRLGLLIRFKHKEPVEDLSSGNILDKAVSRMKGIIYVDMEEIFVRRFEGRLALSFKTGFFNSISIKDFELIMEQEEKFGIIVPKRVEITVRGKIFFSGINEKHVYTYSNHFMRNADN